MTRAEQKNELMEVLQDAPVKMAERFKRDFERMAFDSDGDFDSWIDDVCLEIDHTGGKEQAAMSQVMRERAKRTQAEQVKSVITGLDDTEYYEQRIRGL